MHDETNPCKRYRRSQTYPVSRDISNGRHNSVIVRSSRSYSNTKRSCSSITLLALRDIRTFYTPMPQQRSARYPPGYLPGPICQASPRSVPKINTPSPPWSPWIRHAFANPPLTTDSRSFILTPTTCAVCVKVRMPLRFTNPSKLRHYP